MQSLLRRLPGIWQSEYAVLLVLIVSVQGTVLASQAAAALFFDPVLIGKIRTFESGFSVILLIASFGAPGLAIREIAASRHDPQTAGAQFRNFILLPIIGSSIALACAALLSLAGHTLLSLSLLSMVVAALLLALVNSVRLLSAVGQAVGATRDIAIPVLIGATLCGLIHLAGAWHGTLESWLFGRVAGEACLMLFLGLALRPFLPQGHSFRFMPRHFLRTMARSTVVNLGLITRMAADAAPILLLGVAVTAAVKAGAGSEVELHSNVGYFGIATLLLSLGLLPVSVVCQQAIPVLARGGTDHDPRLVRRTMLVRALGVALAGIAMIGAGLGITLATGLLKYDSLIGALILLPSLLLKASVTACGSILLASNRLTIPIWVNLSELAVVIALFSCMSGAYHVSVAAMITVAGSLVSAAGMGLAALRIGAES